MRLVELASSQDGFKTVHFREDLNLIVANRTLDSASTDTRNGVGKSTFVQIIDFLLGANLSSDPEDRLRKLEGGRWEFHLTLKVSNNRLVTVSRSVDDPASVQLTGDVIGIAAATGSQLDSEQSEMELRIGRWKAWLGEQTFGLESASNRWRVPSFRELVPHFVRYRDDAFSVPFETFRRQPPVQVQAQNAYLLGLDWTIAYEWDAYKKRATHVGAVAGLEQDEIGDRLGSLEAERIRRERARDRLSNDIAEFNVLPEYHEIESRVNGISRSLKELTNLNFQDKKLLSSYREATQRETSAGYSRVAELFEEMGVALPGTVVRTLEEVAAFHQAVRSNRSSYLAAEIEKLEVEVARRETQARQLAAAQQQDMRILESAGALEDFAALQQALGRAEAEIVEIGAQIEAIRTLQRSRTELRSELIQLKRRTEIDLAERADRRSGVVGRFSEIFEILYGADADLIVDSGDAGFRFKVRLPRQGSSGEAKMAVFAYDIAVTESLAKGGRGLGFLIHDSTIFDGVDERQIAIALKLAKASATSFGYQYVATINSDDLPFSDAAELDLDLASATILSLTDGEPSGGLLGARIGTAST